MAQRFLLSTQSPAFQSIALHSSGSAQRSAVLWLPSPHRSAAAPFRSARYVTSNQTPSFRRQPQRVLMAAASGSAAFDAVNAAAGPQTKKRVTYTSYEVNSWKASFEQSGVTVLVDPWLVDELTFGGTSWLYKGEKIKTKGIDYQAVAKSADFMLITQSLPDHCHMPTLEKLPRDLPVVAQLGAAEQCRKLGYTQIYELDHGQTLTMAGGKLTVTGTEGALVGPPWEKRQLGIVFRETAPNGASIYYEPHCDFVQPSVAEQVPQGSVDIVVTPVVNQQLGTSSTGYPLVSGDNNSLDLVRTLRPKIVIPFMNAEMQASGPLSLAIAQKGTLEGFKQKLRDAGLGDIRVQEVAEPPNSMTIEI